MGSVSSIPKRTSPPETLTAAVDVAVADMDWLSESDQAAVRLAQEQAAAIEGAEDRMKAIGWIGPQLLATLRSLGGTPGDRKALGVEAKVKGKLAQLREGRGRAG